MSTYSEPRISRKAGKSLMHLKKLFESAPGRHALLQRGFGCKPEFNLDNAVGFINPKPFKIQCPRS